MGNQVKKPEPLAPLVLNTPLYDNLANIIENDILITIKNINIVYKNPNCIHGSNMNHPTRWNRCQICNKGNNKYIANAYDNAVLALLSLRYVGIINNNYGFVIDPKPEIKMDDETIEHIRQLKPAVNKLIRFRDLYNAKQVRNSEVDECMNSLNRYIEQYQRDLSDIESIEQINNIIDEIKRPNEPDIEGAITN